MVALASGTLAPEFTLTTTGGSAFSLSEALQRGPVVLAFFKISCPVCQYALPFLERIHRALHGRNATIVGISQNTKKDTEMFMREYGITMPVALDDTRTYPVSNAYGLTNVPTTFYIEPGGEIRLSSVGWSRADVEQVNRDLAEAANTPANPVFRPGEEVAEWRAG